MPTDPIRNTPPRSGDDPVDRRDFLKIGAVATAGSLAAAGLPGVAKALGGEEEGADAHTVWSMVIDSSRCKPDCDKCVTACHQENNVRHFPDPADDPQWIRKVTYHQKGIAGAEEHSFPAMCYHCEHPPCAHVCPVAATFKRADGIVLVDKHRCIGCRYCMVACPYKARSFVSQHVEHQPGDNPDVPIRMHGVVEKCTLCVHRLDEGKKPACVEACPEKAMKIGNLKNPGSEVAAAVRTGHARQIRPDLGTNPRVFYLGI